MQNSADIEHLKLLSIFHYVVAGIVGLFSLFPLGHLAMAIAILAGGFNDASGPPPPAVIGWIFLGFSIVFMTLGFTFAICIALAGRKLTQRRGYYFCLIMAGLQCAFMPFGTVLGVFTIIVLVRPSVKLLFERSADPALQAVR